MADDTVDLWAIDEVHFQLHGSRCVMWVPPEVKDPILLHHPTRKKVGYFGAVRLRDGRFGFRREPNPFNGETFLAFLRQLFDHSKVPGRRVVASWTTLSSTTPVSTKIGETTMQPASRWTSCPHTARNSTPSSGSGN